MIYMIFHGQAVLKKRLYRQKEDPVDDKFEPKLIISKCVQGNVCGLESLYPESKRFYENSLHVTSQFIICFGIDLEVLKEYIGLRVKLTELAFQQKEYFRDQVDGLMEARRNFKPIYRRDLIDRNIRNESIDRKTHDSFVGKALEEVRLRNQNRKARNLFVSAKVRLPIRAVEAKREWGDEKPRLGVTHLEKESPIKLDNSDQVKQENKNKESPDQGASIAQRPDRNFPDLNKILKKKLSMRNSTVSAIKRDMRINKQISNNVSSVNRSDLLSKKPFVLEISDRMHNFLDVHKESKRWEKEKLSDFFSGSFRLPLIGLLDSSG